MVINYKSKIRKSGNSNVFVVPPFFIKQGLLDPNKEYNVKLEEVENGNKI